MKYLLILILINFSSAQLPQQAEIDEELTKSRDALIYKELRIGKVLSDFNLQIQNCILNISKSSSLKDLTNFLENLAALIKQQQSVNNFVQYENISTCADINYKITMLDFEQRKYFCVINQVSRNISAIYGQYIKVVGQYSLKIVDLGGIGSRNQQNVFAVIRQTSNVIAELSSYTPLLLQTIGRVSYFNTILSTFKKFYCQCLATVAWTGYNSTLENNTEVVENQLKRFEARILIQANLTLIRVKSALQVATGQSLISALQSLQNTLQNILSVSDYVRISWSNIKNCNDMWNRIRFLEFKRLQYLNIIAPANLNMTYCTIYQSNANSNAGSSISQVQLALNSSTVLRTFFQMYVSQLIFSVNRMSRMIADFNFFGDTHCSCEFITTPSTSTTTTSTSTTTSTTSTSTTSTSTTSTSTTSTSTSTTTEEPTTSTSTTTTPGPTTTSTVAPCAMPSPLPLNTTNSYPCGTFLPYDPVNGRYDPDTWGVPGGINNNDWSTNYVGYGDASGCAGMFPCPGYISTASAKPGAYMSCHTTATEWFDDKKAFYLVWHPNLAWVNTTVATSNTVLNAIKFDYTWFLKLGRVCSSNRLQLGRLHYMASVFRYIDVSGYKEATGTFAFQILTCKP